MKDKLRQSLSDLMLLPGLSGHEDLSLIHI